MQLLRMPGLKWSPASSSSVGGSTSDNTGTGLLGTKIQILDIEAPEARLYKGYSLLKLLQ